MCCDVVVSGGCRCVSACVCEEKRRNKHNAHMSRKVVVHMTLSTCCFVAVVSSCVLVALASCGSPCRRVVFSCRCHGGCRFAAVVLSVSRSRLVVAESSCGSPCVCGAVAVIASSQKKTERRRKRKKVARRSLIHRLKSVLASSYEFFCSGQERSVQRLSVELDNACLHGSKKVHKNVNVYVHVHTNVHAHTDVHACFTPESPPEMHTPTRLQHYIINCGSLQR